jgi:hypothetical protein
MKLQSSITISVWTSFSHLLCMFKGSIITFNMYCFEKYIHGLGSLFSLWTIAIYFLIKAEMIDNWYGNPTSHVNTFSSSSKRHHSIAPLLSKIVWRNFCGPDSCQFSSVCFRICKYDPASRTLHTFVFFLLVWREYLVWTKSSRNFTYETTYCKVLRHCGTTFTCNRMPYHIKIVWRI